MTSTDFIQYSEMKEHQGVEYLITGDYIIKRLTEEEYEDAIGFVASEFVAREPFAIAFNFGVEDIIKEAREKENFCSSGISIICRHIKTQEIVGVALCNDNNYNDHYSLEDYSVGFQNQMGFIDQALEELFEKGIYTREKGVYSHMSEGAISAKHSGNNLGLNFLLFQEFLAYKKGYKFLVVESTNPVTQKHAQAYGFKLLKEVLFEDIILPLSGQKIDMSRIPKGLFRTEKPNIKFMMKKITQQHMRL